MNSLVVLFSLVAVAVAKPSGLFNSEVLTYAAPAIAALPAAVSSQSRIDIKSSPAYVATAIEPITRTVIAEPAATIIAAPASAVSHQSRIDIKSSPATVSSYISTPIATAAIAPTFIKSAIAAPAIATPVFSYAAPAVYKSEAIASPALIKTEAIASPALIKTEAIASPVFKSEAFAAPAVFKTISTPAFFKTAAIDGYSVFKSEATAEPSVPQDTPEVAAARFAHLQAKAEAIQKLEGHVIHKRSAPLIAAPAYTYSAPLVSTYAAAPVVHAAPIAYSAPLTYHTPLITKAYSVHSW